MAITQSLTAFGTVVPPMLVEFALDLIGRLQQSHYPNNRAEYSNRSANRLLFFPAARANVPYEQREQNSDPARLKRRILRIG